MKKEIPILFSTAMVQAILAGRKTMTRRGVKFPLKCPTHHLSIGDSGQAPPARWAKWQPGDLLWVRESFGIYDRPDTPVYKAGDDGWDDIAREQVRFKPSLFMPKSMCRIWLEVTDVRAERLQDMEGATAHECDSLKEGIMQFHHGDGNYGYHWECDMDGKNFVHPCDAFIDLWQTINGPESWEANPWVWVVSFKVLSTIGRPELTYTPSLIASPGEGAVIVEPVKEKTVGQIITEAINLHELVPETVEKVLGLPNGYIRKIMNDEVYTNSIPVVLFKNLLVSLHIRFWDIEPAFILTYKLLKSKETEEDLKKKPHGYMLWENEEALYKYTSHLNKLMVQPPESNLPSRGIDGNDALMEELKKSEIN